MDMILTTSDDVTGYRIIKTIGLVRGNTVRARHVGQDIVAGLKNIIGGEISQYAKLVAETREQSIDRMKEDATRQGANAIVAVRFSTTVLMQGSAELLAYGTAVVIEPD